MAKKQKIEKTPARDSKAETLWEIFEKTGSIGAYLLYMEQVDDKEPIQEETIIIR